MKQAKKTVTRKVKVMGDPNPQFVSIVNHGAIQQPFKVLKSAKPQGVAAMPIARRDPMTGQNVKKTAAGKDVAVQKIVFDKEQFSTEEKVHEYLANNGYSDYALKSDANTITAESNGYTQDSFSRVNKVDMATGITGYVGVLKEGVAKAAVKDTAASAVQEPATVLTHKYDWYNSYLSKAQSVAEIIEAGMIDGIPPGFTTVLEAGMMALGNLLSDENDPEGGREANIDRIFGEMASLLKALVAVFTAATSDDLAQKSEAVSKFIDTFKTEIASMTTKNDAAAVSKTETATGTEATTGETTEQTRAATATEPAKKDEPAAAVGAAAEAATPAAPVMDMKALGTAIGSAIKEALEPVTKSVADLTKKVEEISSETKAATEKATKAAGDVQSFVERFPTKKAASDAIDPDTVQTDEQKKEQARKSEAARNFRSMAGF